MVSTLRQIPKPLRIQMLIKFGYSLIFLFMLFVMLFITRDLYLLLPCASASVFFSAAALTMFRRSVLGDYLVIRGEYQNSGRTAVKRRIKYITMKTGGQTLRVTLHGRLKNVPVGAVIELYLRKDTPVYESDGAQILYQYIAIVVKQRGLPSHV